MFLVDVSSSMGKTRTVQQPSGQGGGEHTIEMTHLEWALQFAKMKVQEMIFNGRKTEQCGVIVFGAAETNNIVNQKSGGYDNVVEYIPIAQPNSGTIAKLDTIQPSAVTGDPIDALIVGIETQAEYLVKKKTWTRKIVLITDGETPMEVEDWEAVSKKMNALDISLTIVGVDFDDSEYPYEEPNKPNIKRANEQFYTMFASSLKNGVVGTCAHALQEIMRPDIHLIKSALMGTVLRVGDTDTRPSEAIEIDVKTSKCTAIQRSKNWKKFALRKSDTDVEVDEGDKKVEYAQLKMRTEYYVDRSGDHTSDEDDDTMLVDKEDLLHGSNVGSQQRDKQKAKEEHLEKVEKEELIRGFKYGTTYVPCPDGQYPKLPTRKGIDICGFFPAKNFRRELSMGEIQYVWADPSSPQQQATLSSLVQAMYEKECMAIARLVTKDGMDPKMGVLCPTVFDKVDCFLWTQMPFADDVRKYSFASLERLVSKNGDVLTSHPYLPNDKQQRAMDSFVDAMDLMEAGDKDDEGNPQPWFDTRLSYNPSLHRTKQALFHCAIVSDLNKNPLPLPHPELLKYCDPPRHVVKRARSNTEECKDVFKVKEVPKRTVKFKTEGHAHAEEEDDGMLLLLDRKQVPGRTKLISQTQPNSQMQTTSPLRAKSKTESVGSDGSATEDDEEGFVQPVETDKKASLPTPARSTSPPVLVHHKKAINMDKDGVYTDDEINPGRAPGRIVGNTNPLKDFRKNLERGDVVTKAVEDMGYVISEVVLRPFAWRRTDEMMTCLKEMRNVALKEDEIDAWNAFMKDLKRKCLGQPGNAEFWQEVKKAGRRLSLISDTEADEYGGTSPVSEKEAKLVRDYVALGTVKANRRIVRFLTSRIRSH
ncbi:hypothetical protein AX17_000444 [Amanita inopinata Kibby_2008]|nr:hypothetical protein AX17_000444 [Amanita inopinata Kibby_2008]